MMNGNETDVSIVNVKQQGDINQILIFSHPLQQKIQQMTQMLNLCMFQHQQ